MMVDTNVVIDLREEDPRWCAWSFDTVRRAGLGNVAASAIVLGELAAGGGGEDEIAAMMDGYAFSVQPLDAAVTLRAGRAHRAYRQAGGTRQRLLADFLIGAHAVVLGQPLATRDPRRYRSYFPELILITPESQP